MTSPTHTPSDLAIQPRDLSFGRGGPGERWWLGGDLVATAYFDALSATFPQGERFFMDAVRRYRAMAPPRLQAQIAAFLSQEAMHTREHLVFNKQFADQGFDVAAMEARIRAAIDFARAQEPLKQLAATAALEHFTAILADAVLADPRHLGGAAAEAKAMWRWHAVEELEHKAVAFDTLIAVASQRSGPRRWALRAASMAIATAILFSAVGRNMADIFAAAGENRPRTWARVFRYLLVRPGMLRQVSGRYLAYFLPGFHPWRRDDRALAAHAARGLVATASDAVGD